MISFAIVELVAFVAQKMGCDRRERKKEGEWRRMAISKLARSSSIWDSFVVLI